MFVARTHRLGDLVVLGTLTPAAAAFLDASVRAGLSIVVSGGTQAGKTTMLNCLSAAIPGRERVVSCEKVFELCHGPGRCFQRVQPAVRSAFYSEP